MKEKLKRQLEILSELAEMDELSTFAIYSKDDLDKKIKSVKTNYWYQGFCWGICFVSFLYALLQKFHIF